MTVTKAVCKATIEIDHEDLQYVFIAIHNKLALDGY